MSLNIRVDFDNLKFNLTSPCADSVNHALNLSLWASRRLCKASAML